MLVKSIYKKLPRTNTTSNVTNSCSGNMFTPIPPPIDTINTKKITASEAYEIVNSESYFDSNPNLNLATFVTTWMEPAALEIMKENINKNYIDKLIYPETSELEKRCVSILSHLYNVTEEDTPTGTSTIGSTEAALLAGLNYKFKWKKWSKDRNLGNPQIIIGTNVQVCWEKFAKYFEVTPVKVPIDQNNKININEVAKRLNDRTICVVGILGNTFSGEFDDIKALNEIVDKYNRNHTWQIPIHVDAASGGFIAPFYNKFKNIPWDFRLKWVKSINISGHKYGLVYPGIGWAIWRNRDDIDSDLIFQIDYLGGSQDDFSLNFSKNANNIIAQYYNLTRLGQEGYEEIVNYLFNIQYYLFNQLANLKINGTKIFKIVNNSPCIPIVVLKLTKEAKKIGLDLKTLATIAKEYGWSIPVYPLPAPYQNELVLRMVLRVGFNYGMAEKLYEDIVTCIKSSLDPDTNSSSASVNSSHGIC